MTAHLYVNRMIEQILDGTLQPERSNLIPAEMRQCRDRLRNPRIYWTWPECYTFNVPRALAQIVSRYVDRFPDESPSPTILRTAAHMNMDDTLSVLIIFRRPFVAQTEAELI